MSVPLPRHKELADQIIPSLIWGGKLSLFRPSEDEVDVLYVDLAPDGVFGAGVGRHRWADLGDFISPEKMPLLRERIAQLYSSPDTALCILFALVEGVQSYSGVIQLSRSKRVSP